MSQEKYVKEPVWMIWKVCQEYLYPYLKPCLPSHGHFDRAMVFLNCKWRWEMPCHPEESHGGTFPCDRRRSQAITWWKRCWKKPSSGPAQLWKRRPMRTPFMRQTRSSGRGCQAVNWAAIVMKIYFFALLCGVCDDFCVEGGFMLVVLVLCDGDWSKIWILFLCHWQVCWITAYIVLTPINLRLRYNFSQT